MRARVVAALTVSVPLVVLGVSLAVRPAVAGEAVEVLSARILEGGGLDQREPLTRLPGSELARYSPPRPADYHLIVGIDAETAQFRGERLSGRLSRYHYVNAPERSIAELFGAYRKELESTGADVVFSCAGSACGPTYSTSRWELYNGIAAYGGSDTSYLAAVSSSPEVRTYIALMVGSERTQVDVVEVETGPETEAAQIVDADALAGSIAEEGRVRVDGILFETNRAALRPESRTAIAEIARLLERNAALELYVVGHTDDVGSIDHNMRLSEQRALAVKSELVREHGVDETRLSAYGVGPLAPVAPNADDDGRSRNRRVEIVAR